MDDFMTKANEVFPAQTVIENLNSSDEWLEMRNVTVQQTNAVQVPHERTRTQTAQGIHYNREYTLDL